MLGPTAESLPHPYLPKTPWEKDSKGECRWGTGRLCCLQPPSPSRQCGNQGKEGCAARPLGTPLTYQVGSGRRALSALLGGVARAGAEVGAGHATSIEGTKDADGGLARADDEELLPITGVGRVVPQHLAQVP